MRLLLATLTLIPALSLAAENADNANPMSMLPMTAAFVGLFYFMIIRPQNKQKKAQSEAISSLKKGDEVALASGIIGVITSVEDSLISLKIAKGTIVTVLKQKILKVMPKDSYQD